MDAEQYPKGKWKASPEKWLAIIEAARHKPTFKALVATWEETGHPGPLETMMEHADAELLVLFKK